MILIRLPVNVASATGGQQELQVEATTVGSALEQLFERFPALRERFRAPTGELRRTLLFFVCNEDIRFLEGESTPLKSGDELTIVPANAGG
jgi:molybdopterin synthase sulfur carrier subunit